MPTPRFVKGLLSAPFARAIASALIVFYVRLVAATTKWDYVGREHADPLNADDAGVIVAFWHQRLLMAAVIRRKTKKRVFMLSSNHRDAEIVVAAGRRFGVEFIRGSASNPAKPGKDKQGGPALVQMIGALRDGHAVGVNPDGPRGPAGRVHIGIIRLAQFSGAPILPGAYSVSGGVFLDSWDRMFIPIPFGRGVFVGAAPIRVPADADAALLEELRKSLESALNAVTAEADRRVGRASPAGRPVE